MKFAKRDCLKKKLVNSEPGSKKISGLKRRVATLLFMGVADGVSDSTQLHEEDDHDKETNLLHCRIGKG